MFKTVDIVKEEDIAITRRQSCNRAIDGDTVDDASLSPVTFAEIAPDMLLRNGCHQVIE